MSLWGQVLARRICPGDLSYVIRVCVKHRPQNVTNNLSNEMSAKYQVEVTNKLKKYEYQKK